METIKVTTEAGEFEFRVEERIKDSLLIEQTAVKYAGGYEQLSELKRLTTIYYDEYHNKLKQVLSEEKYLERISVLTKGPEAADEKQQVVREFLEIAAPEYLKFMEVNNMLENVYKIAKATVLQVNKPGVTRLDDLPSEHALSLIEKMEEELIFFRRQKNRLLRLIQLSETKRLTDPEFQELVKKQAQDIRYWWKTKYNYSSNDPRYLEATDTQIFQDFIEHQIEVHRKDPELESKKLKARIESTPDYDEKLREQVKQLPIDLIELLKSE